MFKKFTTTAATKTHGEEDATLIDVVNPTVALSDSMSNLARSALYGFGGWLARGKKETGSFSL